MQQFFIEDISNPSLTKEQFHQCKNVLRMKQGDEIRLVDQEGKGNIYMFEDNSLENLRFVEEIYFAKNKVKKTLIASLIRSERLEWMIQKACELGVDEIYLYQSDHGVVRDFGKRTKRKMERFNEISKEACEQSYRQYAVPVIGIITKDDISKIKKERNYIMDLGDYPDFYSSLEKDIASVAVILGPEGGFSDKERTFFVEEGFESRSLSKNVLRAETACILSVALLSQFEVIQ